MKLLPLGIQTFSDIVNGGYLYIDKTGYIPELITTHRYAFLSRPRRFGKSLFLSTLHEFFSGNRELFKGLALYDHPDWQKYPVIHLDLSDMSTDGFEAFRKSLLRTISSICEEHGLTPDTEDVSDLFSTLISELARKHDRKVVILIDEFDKPITDNIGQPEIALLIRDLLRSFFGRMKGNDRHIRFALMTGVSKFAKVSLFSGLNQISDISLDPRFSAMLGYTQDDLESSFSDRIPEMAVNMNMLKDDLLSEIRSWYNGYSWDGKVRLYNPYSILSLFNLGRFENFWYQTGSPTFLYSALKTQNYTPEDLDDLRVESAVLDNIEISELNTAALFFQTGYLSIKEIEFDGVTPLYRLGYPNREVKQSFFRSLFIDLLDIKTVSVLSAASDLRDSLRNGEPGKFESILKSLFARIPSNLYIEEEKYFHSLFMMIMYLCGIDAAAEVNTNVGRIDGVIEFDDLLYIVEFKYSHSPEKGLEQILKKKYYERYLNSSKEIFLLGVGITRESVRIATVKVK